MLRRPSFIAMFMNHGGYIFKHSGRNLIMLGDASSLNGLGACKAVGPFQPADGRAQHQFCFKYNRLKNALLARGRFLIREAFDGHS